MNKEEIYDEYISPLIALCKEHKINMFAHFSIPCEDNEGLRCTTSLPLDKAGDPDGYAEVDKLERTARPRAEFVALTITTGKP